MSDADREKAAREEAVREVAAREEAAIRHVQALFSFIFDE